MLPLLLYLECNTVLQINNPLFMIYGLRPGFWVCRIRYTV